MIGSFSTLYAGHVLDGDGVGFGGTPADDRWYSNERLIEAFDISREAAQLTEDLGFDVFWMAEHHFQREGYECIPNLLMLSLWLAERTRTIKLGCAFNILPMWHPIRLAEDFAMADILTNGRVVFGVGRGYHTREVESFGTPMLDGDANRELFEEQFEVILKAFNQESFSHKGKHYTIPPDVPYRGYPPQGGDPGAPPRQPAGGRMAAHRQRQLPRVGLHGQARHQGNNVGHRKGPRGQLDPPVPGGQRPLWPHPGPG